jgi:hypothetical protein
VPLRKKFTLDSPLEEMKMELEFIKREKSMDNTIKQFSEWFVTGMSGLEWGSQHVNFMKAFGLQLNGLSEAAQMNVADMEDDFEELYELYGDNLKMHPLVKIPLRTCQMVYMVHLTNQMAARMPIPNMQDILRQNPDMARTLASQAMAQQTQQMRSAASPAVQQQSSGGGGGSNPLAGLMNFMQGNMPSAPPPQPNVVPRPPPDNKPIRIATIPQTSNVSMKPPSSNIDDLLKDIQKSVQVQPGNPPPAPMKVKKPAGSTGKNSVIIKL